MKIKCWGSRGSIPVSGKEFVKYGGDTTCIEITADSGETIIIDAGTGIRRLGNDLLDRNIFNYHLLFTHAHWDHILGLAFFRPLQFKKVNMIVQDRKFFNKTTQDVLNALLKQPFFPITIRDLSANLVFDKSINGSFQIGSVKIESIPISHPGGGVGYKLIEGNSTFVFLTDNELGHQHPGGKSISDYIDFVKNVDLLVHDAEYTPEEYEKNVTWGHSTFPEVLDLAIKANVKRLGLFHQNQNRTDNEVDEIVKVCKQKIQDKGLSLDCFAVAMDMELHT